MEKDEKVVSGMLLSEGCIWFAESFSEIMYTEDLATESQQQMSTMFRGRLFATKTILKVTYQKL
jgi:hypothetical protein